MSSLDSFTAVDYLQIADNDNFTSLAGLGSLASAMSLGIGYNDSLPACEVDALSLRLGVPCPDCSENNGTGTCGK